MTIAIIGLGYVGLPLAVEFARRRPVVGFDINAARVESLRSGHDATREVSDSELAEVTASGNLRFTTQAEDIADCTCYIITVPTPITEHKRPDLRALLGASATVGRLLKPEDIVIYESTVFPGCTEEECVPVLERESGLTCITPDTPPGVNGFHVGYSPERINPGDKEHRVANITKVTSGSTPQIAETIDALYREIIMAGTHKAESIRVAEAAKVIENTQRDLNIALMNELSVLFARLGIDTEAVLRAASTKWNFLPFRPGLVGGHCISVDPYYLTEKAERVGYIPQVILAGRRINDNMGRYVARTTIKKMIQNGTDVTRATVGVLGLTFKENCPDLRNSRVIDIIREFQDYGVAVVAEDPWADPEEVVHEYPDVHLGRIDADHPVDALIIAVGHDVYARRDAQTLRALLRGDKPVIADVKSVYDRHALAAAGVTVWRL
ncbi:nucleotide sugar dehydrogenase [Ectothiorhodospira variabilis]|uniref:nucleotide sugar dehydrogenase n=1 Tax=Ectothiorhodospira variabilis TaxID=505694 RepID=UPI001EFA98EF|nr:nucleotide sugar dehydrogenase [Ectothiorhodospira variabilis]MCG5495457.1 nucleotide sugar dehydrogenase [Ectothiorhodospira variabilis]MCG5505055.1 nucleotide sugar dehydrogenase [Ectothiorhodospira variabilis]MCG5508212.1 nucleotide sugar dehydrogenase [Ectothiorhodospira variabilis]